jgi:arabinofuranan 3-O-arabinosyltransferase
MTETAFAQQASAARRPVRERDGAPETVAGWWQRFGVWIGAAVLAVFAYVPALTSSPGRMPADTKLYLYLDPDRLIADAPWTFDGRQFAGWVPHQVIAYLWPQGPWYSLGSAAGLPDWVTHRLWIGTLMFAAGAGVLWAGRKLGLGVGAAFAAACVYQFAPYLLPYVSRTSAMLLPWAGLGWIVGLTALAATRSKWRHAALCALAVASVGAVNATALLMVAPAPILWLLVATLERRVAWRRSLATVARIGGLSLVVSLWWMVAVVIQGRRGAEVLAYSESLESVSFTSTSTEVWRGLGYWLTYIRDPFTATTTAGADYMTSGRLIAGGFVLLVIALLGVVLTRWRERRFAIGLIVTGVVLGVGVHELADPSPVMDVLAGDGESGLALALRSSTRAVPMLMLGLALGAGALVDSLGAFRLAGRGARKLTLRPLAMIGVVLLALANLPSLLEHRLVDPALERDQDVPQAWVDAAAALDEEPSGGRVLQLPGLEFGAFRWGYTVDPPLPGLTERPLVTRDLLPLGSAAAMDLLYALDDRFQTGSADAGALAPIARLLGVDTIWMTGDVAFERFRSPRPEVLRDFLATVPGLGPARAFGDPAANLPDVAVIDEQSVSDARISEPIPPVELIPVDDPIGVVRVKDREVLVSGSADGLVDAAAAGLIDGTELIRYTASLLPDDVAPAVDSAAEVVVTDANRQRAHHWRSSQDVVGFTEDGDPATTDVLRRDVADQRLPVFESTDPATMTVAIQDGPVRAFATGYGEPFAYRPEDRAVHAIDGDPATAWVVADRFDPVGERLVLELDAGVDGPIDAVTLRQPDGAEAVRHLGSVTIDVDGRPVTTVELDEQSLEPVGQSVDLPPIDPSGSGAPVEVGITIDSVVVPDDTVGPATAAVGFSEVDFGLEPTVEVVRVPTDVVGALEDDASTPVSYVFTRLRTRPTDRWRSDPEPMLVRQFDVPGQRAFSPAVTVRLDQRASDAVLAALFGISGPLASSRLTGVSTATGWSVADGDPATSWITPFAEAVGARLTVPVEGPVGGPVDGPVDELIVTQPAGDFSPITGLRLTTGGASVDVAVPPPDAAGRSVVELPAPLHRIDAGAEVEVEITTVDPRATRDRRFGELVTLPAAISELSLAAPVTIPAEFDSGCRDDLVELDGEPIQVRVRGAVGDLLAGAAVDAEPCGASTIDLAGGTHRLMTIAGSGLQVDQVTLAEDAREAAEASPGPTVEVTEQDRLSRTARVDGCTEGCWLVLGEGYNEAWSATAGGVDLGPPKLVDGGFNGWQLGPTDGPVEVTMQWTAQRPQTIALIISAVGVLACLALAGFDRRTAPARRVPTATLALREPPVDERRRWFAAGVWVVAAALFVGFGWTLLAAIAAAVLVLWLGRPRLAGLVTIGVLVVMGAVVVRIVQSEHPFPNAGWPHRFESLHGLGLFAAITLLVAAFADPSPRPPTREATNQVPPVEEPE